MLSHIPAGDCQDQIDGVGGGGLEGRGRTNLGHGVGAGASAKALHVSTQPVNPPTENGSPKRANRNNAMLEICVQDPTPEKALTSFFLVFSFSDS